MPSPSAGPTAPTSSGQVEEGSQQTAGGTAERASGQAFRGHEPEAGWTSRWRSWTDVFPPAMLLRCFRAVGSPLVFLVAWLVLIPIADGSMFGANSRGNAGAVVVLDPLTWVTTPIGFAQNLWLSWSNSSTAMASWEKVIRFVYLALIVMPATAVWIRVGMVLTAGRPMPGAMQTARLVGVRYPRILLATLGWGLAVGFMAAIGWIAFRIGSWFDLVWWNLACSIIGWFPLAVAGLLGVGGCLAVPLSWASLLANERDDALDAVSRGFECVLRGYPALAGCLLCWLLVIATVTPAAWCLSAAMRWLSEMLMPTLAPEVMTIAVSWMNAAVLPTFWWVTAATAWGGIYLLLRRVTTGQEIEDIWFPTEDVPVELPVLKR